MRTITKTFKLYKVDELSKDAFKYAKDKHISIVVKDMIDDYKTKMFNEMNELGFNITDVYYKLGSGDNGVYFLFDVMYNSEIENIVRNLKGSKSRYELEVDFDDIDISKIREYNLKLDYKLLETKYTNAYTVNILLEPIVPPIVKEQSEYINGLRGKIFQAYHEICMYYKILGTTKLEEIREDKYFINYSQGNYIEYLENGVIYKED